MPSPQTAEDRQSTGASAAPNSSQAFEMLVNRHARWLFAAAYRQLRDRHLAEDATQTVFILLLQRSKEMGSHQKLSAWLFNTLQFTIRNMLRVQRRRAAREYQGALQRRASEPSMHDDELPGFLDAAVERLPKIDRAALILRFYQDLSFEEVARTLGVTEAAARKRVTRAVERLRHYLGQGITESSLSVAAAHGLSDCPAHICRSASHAAVSAHAVVNTGPIASTVKGMAYLMATTSTKATISLVLLILFITVGAATIGTQLFHTNHEETALRPPAIAAEVHPADAVPTDIYVLDGGEALRRLAHPQGTARRALFAKLAATGFAGNNPAPPVALIIGLKGTSLQEWSWDFDHHFTLSFLLEYLLQFYPQQVEGAHAAISISGDFVFNVDANIDARRAALQKILQDELHEPLELTLRSVPRKVIVLHGHWRFTPASSSRAHNNVAPLIELYERNISRAPTNAGAGDSSRFAGGLGKYIGRQIIIEAENLPTGFFWSLNDSSGQPHDVQLVLNHVKEQTNLSWSEETRTVQRLFIEPRPSSAATTEVSH
jgi:RNA polymerase sigma factor (sigma-70 family)